MVQLMGQKGQKAMGDSAVAMSILYVQSMFSSFNQSSLISHL